jgi:probable HAF family extracellular repeat protein
VPDSPRPHPTAINDRGDILIRAAGSVAEFVYRDGTFTPIVQPSNGVLNVLGINNKGDIVGGFVDFDSSGTAIGLHGFIFDGKTYQTIDYPGSMDTWFTGINDKGQVIGQYTTSPLTSSTRSFLWDRGTFMPLDIPGTDGRVTGINNRGEIVGTYNGYCASQDVNGGLSFVYYKGNYTCFVVPDSINVQPAGRFAATNATGINDLGQVVGYWSNRFINIHSFIATPQSD